MKIIVSLCISILILAGCGKKSEPKAEKDNEDQS